MKQRISAGSLWLRLPAVGLSGAVRTACRRAALLVLTAAIVFALGDFPAIATTDPSRTSPAATGDVVVANAEMLTNLVQAGLAPALAPRGITIHSISGMSVSTARNIRNGSLKADLFASADANDNQLLTGDANGNKVRWFVGFARDSIVLAYSPHSRYLAQFQAAQRGQLPWYTPLEQPGITVARSNPDDDPSGYYTLFVAQLAERFSGQKGLKQRILGDDRNPAQLIGPNSGDILAKLQSGQLDALFTYGSVATSLGLPHLTLPARVNLSDPAYQADYALASFTTSDGITFRGGVIRPSIAPITSATNTPAALEVLNYLFSPPGQALIKAKDFLPSPLLIGGDINAVPQSLRQYIRGRFTTTPHSSAPGRR